MQKIIYLKFKFNFKFKGHVLFWQAYSECLGQA